MSNSTIKTLTPSSSIRRHPPAPPGAGPAAPPSGHKKGRSRASGDEIQVRGRSDGNNAWVEFFNKGTSVLMPLEEFGDNQKLAYRKMRAAEMPVVTPQTKARLANLVEEISSWDFIDIAQVRGLHNRCFVLSKNFVAPAMFATVPM